jgi:hypothetical protein
MGWHGISQLRVQILKLIHTICQLNSNPWQTEF